MRKVVNSEQQTQKDNSLVNPFMKHRNRTEHPSLLRV